MGLFLVVMGIAIIACKTQGVVDLSFFILCLFFFFLLPLIPQPAEYGVEEFISESCPDAGVG